MNYKNFSQEIYDQVESLCQKYKGQKLYAAFDADGTLWDTDMGEDFFQWQIKNNKLPDLPPNPWEYYKSLRDQQEPVLGLAWLAQINKGKSLDQVRDWAQQALAERPTPIFESQKKMIQLLKNYNVEIFIVTASVKWAVEPGAALMGIDRDHVLGVKTKIKDGIITDELDGAVPWKQGKADTLLAMTKGVRPIFCSGNTMGDYFLLKAATDYSLVVGACVSTHSHYKNELEVQEIALGEKWRVHKFT